MEQFKKAVNKVFKGKDKNEVGAQREGAQQVPSNSTTKKTTAEKPTADKALRVEFKYGLGDPVSEDEDPVKDVE
jgi:hypothetical protein